MRFRLVPTDDAFFGLFNDSAANVFDALEVLRWKDVIESMERALNTLEDISDIVESIVLKHA
jgi:hypothetical protein